MRSHQMFAWKHLRAGHVLKNPEPYFEESLYFLKYHIIQFLLPS